VTDDTPTPRGSHLRGCPLWRWTARDTNDPAADVPPECECDHIEEAAEARRDERRER